MLDMTDEALKSEAQAALTELLLHPRYLVSLARIRSYSPTLIYGGHGDPIDDYEEIFNRYVRPN